MEFVEEKKLCLNLCQACYVLNKCLLFFQREFYDRTITLLILVISDNKNSINYVYNAYIVPTVLVHRLHT